ncbi:hypothetical protein N7490_006411 [Penicillium lividum]|nr:hypothetical protein N7490_006411 [Penicillium lividum]
MKPLFPFATKYSSTPCAAAIICAAVPKRTSPRARYSLFTSVEVAIVTSLQINTPTIQQGTLWPLDDEDGATFGTTFYRALFEERDATLGRVEAANLDKRQPQEQAPEASAFFTRAVDLAKVFQQSILRLRHDDARQDRKAPYNWASFTLNEFWFLPTSSVPTAIPAVDRQG